MAILSVMNSAGPGFTLHCEIRAMYTANGSRAIGPSGPLGAGDKVVSIAVAFADGKPCSERS